MAIECTTWNPSDKHASITLSNGNLTATKAYSAWGSVRSTVGKNSGKWYWEIVVDANPDIYILLGVGNSSAYLSSFPGGNVNGYGYREGDGKKLHNNVANTFGDSYTTNDVISIALDMDAGKIWWAKNGIWQASGNPGAGTGEAYSGLSGTFYAMFGAYQSLNQITANFGASVFSYNVPNGFNPGFYTGFLETFTFTNPIPAHLSTVYGTTKQLQLTTTISGSEPSYTYDASFYDSSDVQIGTTISGINSGSQASSNVDLPTPSGVDYSWYVTATSSGSEDTSSTYTFSNRFLASGTTEVDGTLTSGIDVRLYRRDTGELVGTAISTVSGIFNIETQYNSECYCVALSPYTDTNSLMYDFLEPGD